MTNHEDADFAVAADGPPDAPEPGPRVVISLCGSGTCPTVYQTDHDTVLVQGAAATGVAVLAGEHLVEIPLEVFLEAASRLQNHGA
jgi:hypothetical protein